MRIAVLVWGFVGIAPFVHAVCPAAPVSSAQDTVIRLKASGGVAGIGPAVNMVSNTQGALVFDSAVNTLKFCDGTNWVDVAHGVDGVPAGAVMAFALTACPAGWSEYTPARGRFLRGRDNGAGIDPDGTRAPGNAQNDALQNIVASFTARNFNGGGFYSVLYGPSGAFYVSGDGPAGNGLASAAVEVGKVFTFDASRVVRTANETRPKNVAVLFCRKT